jgi:hypothetical protein
LVITIGSRRLEIADRGIALVLLALVAAGGEWVTPMGARIAGPNLSKRVAALRSRYGLAIETDTVQDGPTFWNRHRLRPTLVIELDTNGRAALRKPLL